jgi:hypothetical protein
MLCLATTCLLVSSTYAASLAASAQARNEQELAQKIRGKIVKIGSGPKARVEVKLKDGNRVKGYISEVGADHFAVTDKKTGGVTTISYAQARQVKTPNENPLKDPKVWLGLALIPTILAIGLWAKGVD